ncbi:MAG: transposase [Salinicola sp.]|nr:transposase [Salinicola sp.]
MEKANGRHALELECQTHNSENRLIKPGRPQANGMIERFNSRIRDVFVTGRYESSKEDLE